VRIGTAETVAQLTEADKRLRLTTSFDFGDPDLWAERYGSE
jgi:hypothetical protein